MKRDDHLVFSIVVAVALFAVALLVILHLRTQLDDLRAHRAAVADVENFIYQKFPTMDAATRRGHAELLTDASCVEVVENIIGCPGVGFLVMPPPEVRQHALRAAEKHGIKLK